jgi:hypothetical protein
MEYLKRLEQTYTNKGAYELPYTLTGFEWIEKIVEDGEVRPGSTPRETFEIMLEEGKLELA